MLPFLRFFTLSAITISSPSLVAQEVVFDSNFNTSATITPTNTDNLNIGSTIGIWSNLPVKANSIAILDSNGDKGLLIDRPTANTEVNAHLTKPAIIESGSEVSFSYTVRRTSKSHRKDITVTGYSPEGLISFQTILTALSGSSTDEAQIAYTHPTAGYTDIPASSTGDHSFLSLWDPAKLVDIKLILSENGYVVEHDGDNGQWTSATLPYTGEATSIERIGFRLNGGSTVRSSGLWLDNVLVLADTINFPVMITEVMSDNDNTLSTADGSSPDWIELTNLTDNDYDLSGAYLTDDSTDLVKWSFPENAIVPANGSLVVFASGDDFSSGDEIHTSFKLSSGGEYLALVADDGVTIEQEFAPFLPKMHEDVSYGFGPDLVSLGFFETPTPGTPNGALTVETGAIVNDLTEDPAFSPANIPVTVEVHENGSTVTTVTLHYRIGYGQELQLPMSNTSGNIWSATIPTSNVPEGEMLRWRTTASDELGRTTPFPANVPADTSPRYNGVVADDSSINTTFPVLHTFVEDPDWYKDEGWDQAGRTNKPNNSNFSQISLSFNGRFYDNAQMRTRGNSAATWEKPKFKIELNEGYEMEWDPSEEAVDEFNLQSHFIDQFPGARTSFLREYAYLGLANEVGMPTFHMFYTQVRQNSDYFGLFSFTEQINATFLRRHGMDDDGALYKATDGGTLSIESATEEHFSKATQKDEPYNDLVELVTQLNASEPERSDYVFDHLDLPGIINKFAVDALTYNYDRVHHNFYVYHNPQKDEWTQLVWDTDLSFLVNSRLNDVDLNHPLYLDGNDGRPFNGMSKAIFENAVVREMYYRRLRTLMDEYLATTWMDDLLTNLNTQIASERSTDATEWGLNLSNVQNDLINNYLPTRREQLFVTWGSLFPTTQPLSSIVDFGQVVVNPISGNQDEEFIEITNSNDWAVDVSNWVLSDGVSFTFPPGSVIPANSNCYISPDVVSFRNRAISPTGAEQRFVLGNYSGNLSNIGETLTLSDDEGTMIAQINTPAIPSDNQLYLVISELMYDPLPDEDAEFIELLNTSNNLTLDLSGVQFTDGIDYTFPAGTSLAPGERIVVTKIEFTSGSLKNGGETIKLDDSDGSTISEFTYDNGAPWPSSPGEIGTSLIFISGDPNDPQNWRASLAVGGNLGTSDSVPYDGGDLTSYALDGTLTFDPLTKTLNATRSPGADDASITLQWSSDLITWNDDETELLGTEPLQWQELTTSSRRFYRLLIEIPSP